MKKKILLILAIVALLTCLFAVGAFADDAATTDPYASYYDDVYTALDGTPLAVYENEGDNHYPLAWFYDSETETYESFRVGTEVIFAVNGGTTQIPSGTDFRENASVVFADETKTYTLANLILVNLHQTKTNMFSGTWKNLPIQAIYCNNDFAYVNGGTFNSNTSLCVFDIPKTHTRKAATICGAFSGCTNLKEIYVPKYLCLLGGAFSGCTGLEKVEFAAEYEPVGFISWQTTQGKESWFYGCTSLETVILPTSSTTHTYIGAGTFYKCTSLEEIVIPSYITELRGSVNNGDNGIFEDCTSLKSITIPASVTVMNGNTFTNCSALEEVIFEERNGKDLSFGGWGTFEKCSSLKEMIIPEGVTALSNGFANECTALQKVSLPTTLTTLNGSNHFHHAGNNSATGKIEIIGLENTQIVSFPQWCFRQMNNWYAKELRLPNTCTTIEYQAFADANIETFYIGANVTTIGEGALAYNKTALKAMYIPSTVTSIASNAFYGNNGSALYIIVGVDDASSTVIDTIETAVQSGKAESAYIKYADYAENPSSYTGKNIVYGGNKCTIFYKNEHTMAAIEGNACQELCTRCLTRFELENPQHANVWVFTDENGEEASLLAVMIATEICESCGKESTVHEIEAIFKTVGYSYEEDKNGNYTGVYQKTTVNKTALALYAELTGNKDAYNYGIVGGLAADNNGNEINGNLINVANGVATPANGTTVISTFVDTQYTIVQIKITGLTDKSLIYCGAFITIGNNVTYVCGTTQGNVATKVFFPAK